MISANPNVYASSAVSMTPPKTLAEAVKRILLRDVYDRCMRTFYKKFESGVKCLTFHYVFDDEVDKLYACLSELKKLGTFVSTTELAEIISEKKELKRRYFHVSIDDGFENIMINAHSVFRDLSIPYTMFVCPSFIGEDSCRDIKFMEQAKYAKPLRLATWAQLRELKSNGVEIGSHTMSHIDLGDSQHLDRLHFELGQSKALIESQLMAPCDAFAWPFGRASNISEQAINLATEYGYRLIFSGIRGTIHPHVFRSRVVPRHHFEPYWPKRSVLYYALRRDRKADLRGGSPA